MKKKYAEAVPVILHFENSFILAGLCIIYSKDILLVQLKSFRNFRTIVEKSKNL